MRQEKENMLNWLMQVCQIHLLPQAIGPCGTDPTQAQSRTSAGTGVSSLFLSCAVCPMPDLELLPLFHVLCWGSRSISGIEHTVETASTGSRIAVVVGLVVKVLGPQWSALSPPATNHHIQWSWRALQSVAGYSSSLSHIPQLLVAW